jgi:hypothetical protein
MMGSVCFFDALDLVGRHVCAPAEAGNRAA